MAYAFSLAFRRFSLPRSRDPKVVSVESYKHQRFGFHNFLHSIVTFLISRGKDVKTIPGLLRHAKVTTTLDLYSQSIDASKLNAQEDMALAITSSQMN
jgi:integrase